MLIRIGHQNTHTYTVVFVFFSSFFKRLITPSSMFYFWTNPSENMTSGRHVLYFSHHWSLVETNLLALTVALFSASINICSIYREKIVTYTFHVFDETKTKIDLILVAFCYIFCHILYSMITTWIELLNIFFSTQIIHFICILK